MDLNDAKTELINRYVYLYKNLEYILYLEFNTIIFNADSILHIDDNYFFDDLEDFLIGDTPYKESKIYKNGENAKNYKEDISKFCNQFYEQIGKTLCLKNINLFKQLEDHIYKKYNELDNPYETIYKKIDVLNQYIILENYKNENPNKLTSSLNLEQTLIKTLMAERNMLYHSYKVSMLSLNKNTNNNEYYISNFTNIICNELYKYIPGYNDFSYMIFNEKDLNKMFLLTVSYDLPWNFTLTCDKCGTKYSNINGMNIFIERDKHYNYDEQDPRFFIWCPKCESKVYIVNEDLPEGLKTRIIRRPLYTSGTFEWYCTIHHIDIEKCFVKVKKHE